MADRMLTIKEGVARGLAADPYEFRDITHRIPAPFRDQDPDAGTRWYESRWFFLQLHECYDALDNEMVWLSIRRNDRKPLSDFRQLQRIKNVLLGDEWEAVQLYPAESRLLDESNQTHLWCYPPGANFPFGYSKRSVLTGTEHAMVSEHYERAGMGPQASVQRAFSDEEEATPRPLEELINDEGVTSTIHRPRNPRKRP